MRISDWSSDVCSSDLLELLFEFVDMMLLAFEDVGEQVAAHIVAHALAMGDSVLEQRDRLFLKREVGLQYFLDRFADAQPAAQLEVGQPAPNKDAVRQLVGILHRSAERRVGKECVSKCRYRWSPA